MHRKLLMFCGIILAVSAFLIVQRFGRSVWVPVSHRILGKETVEATSASLEEKVGAKVRSRVARAKLPYPPDRLIIVGLKEERVLEVWGTSGGDVWQPIAGFPVLAASGKLGPKLREGDRQVPEGIYDVVSRNPNSAYHLSLELSYPNEFDERRAADEGRSDLGGDIFIHGSDRSAGCLAVGDDAIEELFLLVGDVGLEDVRVIIAPRDLRSKIAPPNERPWVTGLYAQIADAMQRLQLRD